MLNKRVWSFTVLVAVILANKAIAGGIIDREFSVQRIGYLKSWDNADGIFSDYITEAYKSYFSIQSRFISIDLSKADILFNKSKIPYQKIIEDKEILVQLSRSMKTDTLIRTKVLKQGYRYELQVDWIHMPKLEILAKDSFFLEEGTDGHGVSENDIKKAISDSQDRIISKIPFLGQVTGRDGEDITIDIGRNANIKKGDQLIIETIDQVKKHPLLNEYVDWNFTEIGKIEVVQVDQMISFAKVIEERPGRLISKYQKITHIISAEDTNRKSIKGAAEETPKEKEQFHYGWIRPGLELGGLTRQYEIVSPDQYKRDDRYGTGFVFGPAFAAQVWFTNAVFADIDMSLGMFKYNQWKRMDVVNNSGAKTEFTGNGNIFDFKGAIGYSFIFSDLVENPQAYVRAGFHTTSLILPKMQQYLSGPLTMYSFFTGIGGNMPIQKTFGLKFNFDIGLIKDMTEGNYQIVASFHEDTVDLGAEFGGFYWLNSRMQAYIGMNYIYQKLSWVSRDSVDHSLFKLVPSLIYYF